MLIEFPGASSASSSRRRTGDPAVCAQCARTSRTCCALAPGAEGDCFPVSKLEWERILDFAGQRGAFVQEPNTKPFVDMVARLFPGERKRVETLFPLHGVHLRLATEHGRCRFLGSTGCDLPREARPFYCQLYPLWVYGERVTCFEASGCCAVRQNADIPALLDAMAMTHRETLTLFGRLRLAWGLEPGPGFAPGPPQP